MQIRELDYLAIHVYPINPKFLDNAREMVRIVRIARIARIAPPAPQPLAKKL